MTQTWSLNLERCRTQKMTLLDSPSIHVITKVSSSKKTWKNKTQQLVTIKMTNVKSKSSSSSLKVQSL